MTRTKITPSQHAFLLAIKYGRKTPKEIRTYARGLTSMSFTPRQIEEGVGLLNKSKFVRKYGNQNGTFYKLTENGKVQL